MRSDFTVAVHAAVYLAHKGTVVSSGEIAANVCTNAARVRGVLAKLVKAGLVEAKEGADGGYRAVDGAGNISLGAILAACGESLVEQRWKSGDADKDCLISSGMAAVLDGIYAELDAICRQWLADITLGEIEKKLIGDKI